MMTERGNAIISQILIGMGFMIGAFFLFLFIYVPVISNSFTAFCWNDYQGKLTLIDVIMSFLIYYLPIIGIVASFGIFERNIIVNLVGILWAVPSFGWIARNFALFQPYFFTTWEGALFLVDIAARVLVLLIAIVGIVVTCRSWYRWYKKRKNAATEGETNAKMVK